MCSTSQGAAFLHQGWTGTPGEHLGRKLPGRYGGTTTGGSRQPPCLPFSLVGATLPQCHSAGRPNSSSNADENLQDYLQRHFCAAMARVARELRDETNVLGFDTLNEPSNGWIGIKGSDELQTVVPYGWDTSAFNLLLAGSGFRIDNLAFYRSPMTFTNSLTLNPTRSRRGSPRSTIFGATRAFGKSTRRETRVFCSRTILVASLTAVK